MGQDAPTRFTANLPDGVIVHELSPHPDTRGIFTEIHRDEWMLGERSVQFNVVRSNARVLRGVHVHARHADYFVLVVGQMLMGLHDLRPWSPTHRVSCLIALDEDRPQAVVTPPGVAHGFYFLTPAVHIYGVSHYWDKADEIALRWDCADLGLAWPSAAPLLSERDQAALDYATGTERFLRTWEAMHGAVRAGAAS
jgi:dTDP-4-dehydrorhamnose 3,5-epimerase